MTFTIFFISDQYAEQPIGLKKTLSFSEISCSLHVTLLLFVKSNGIPTKINK